MKKLDGPLNLELCVQLIKEVYRKCSPLLGSDAIGLPVNSFFCLGLDGHRPHGWRVLPTQVMLSP